MFTRRDLLIGAMIGAAANAAAAAGPAVTGAKSPDGAPNTPALGLLGPVEATVPPEATALSPSGVRF
jgi:hypothetical protein